MYLWFAICSGQQVCKKQGRTAGPTSAFPNSQQEPLLCLSTHGVSALRTPSPKSRDCSGLLSLGNLTSEFFLTALLLLCSGFFLTLLETAQCCSRTKLPSRPAEATHSPAGCQGQRGRQPEPSSHQPALQEGKPSKCKTILE